MDANEIRRQEAERDYLLRVNETGAAYRPVRIDGTPAKGSIAADLKAAQEEIQRLVLQIEELKKNSLVNGEYRKALQSIAMATSSPGVDGSAYRLDNVLKQIAEDALAEKRFVPSSKCPSCGYVWLPE